MAAIVAPPAVSRAGCGAFRKADGMATRRDLISVLSELATHHAAAAELAKEAYDLAANGRAPKRRSSIASGNGARSNGLVVSSSTCAVRWRGRCCVLGPSMPLRLIHRLAQHPNRFFTYDMLMDEVWERRCSDAALRALVCRLRRSLKDAEMLDLADAIRVQGRCVGLFLNGAAH